MRILKGMKNIRMSKPQMSANRTEHNWGSFAVTLK